MTRQPAQLASSEGVQHQIGARAQGRPLAPEPELDAFGAPGRKPSHPTRHVAGPDPFVAPYFQLPSRPDRRKPPPAGAPLPGARPSTD